MCLFINRYTLPRIALWNIVCYKCIHVLQCEGETTYHTPYMRSKVQLGKTYTSKIYRFKTVVDEAIHSFCDLGDVQSCIAILSDGGTLNSIVVKCIIPMGSVYYKGHFWGAKSYASNRLKYVEIMK
jgi:hypothetical protein